LLGPANAAGSPRFTIARTSIDLIVFASVLFGAGRE
jgi:hypothetical protein